MTLKHINRIRCPHESSRLGLVLLGGPAVVLQVFVIRQLWIPMEGAGWLEDSHPMSQVGGVEEGQVNTKEQRTWSRET